MSKIPVLLLIYNRPILTKKLLKKLSTIKPKKIFISSDGPKNKLDELLCDKTKKLIKGINWNCSIKKNFLKKNYGCKEAVSRGLNWFFNYNSSGIILEDDCIPNKDFFDFCKKMLTYYKSNKNIGCITGNNFLNNKMKFENNYYFSKYANCWGWATWRRAWRKYDSNVKFWPKFKKLKKWKNNSLSNIERRYWEMIFNKSFNDKIDSWAYCWTLSLWKNNMCTVTPSKNLVKNIGITSSRRIANFSPTVYNVQSINFKKIKFYNKININTEADKYVFDNHFKGKYQLYPWKVLYLLKILLSIVFLIFKKKIQIK